MELILDGLEEGLGDGGVRPVVNAALLVDVGHLQVEAPLARTDRAYPVQQFFEVVRAEVLALLQPVIVQNEALDDELPKGLRRPDAKLGCFEAVHAVADGDHCVEVVVFDIAGDLAATLGLNSQNFFASCRARQLLAFEDVAEVVADGLTRGAKEFGHAILCEPKGLILEEDLHPRGAVRGAVEEDFALKGRLWVWHDS